MNLFRHFLSCCRIAIIAFVAFWTNAQLCKAQVDDFVEVDWNTLKIDSVLPYYTTSFPLGSNYEGCKYSVDIEYPELELLSVAETLRMKALAPSLPCSPKIEACIGVSRRRGQLDVSFVPVVMRDGRYYRIKSFKWDLRIEQSMSDAPLTRVGISASSRYAVNSVLSSGKWAKIRVSDKGIYKLTAKSLRSMGFSDMSTVRVYGYGGHMLSETNIQNLPDDLSEIPTLRIKDGVLFYANGVVEWKYNATTSLFEHRNNPYSLYSYYFVTDSGEGLPMDIEKESSPASFDKEVSTGKDYALYERDEFAWFQSGRYLFDSYEFSNNASQSYKFSLSDVVQSSKAYATIAFSANSSAVTTLSIGVDGVSVGSMQIQENGTYDAANTQTGTYTLSSLSNNPTVTLNHKTTSATGRLDYIALNYVRTLKLNGSQMNFRNPSAVGNVKFTLSSDERSDLHVWKVSKGETYKEMSLTSESGGCSFVTKNSSTDEYVAFSENESFKSPTYVGKVDNQNLHSLTSTDMIIIVPESGVTSSAAAKLAQLHRDRDGMKVEVVCADKIYNEFSSGTPDATAYRRLVKMLYDRADDIADAPKFVLLFGDAAWDNRMLTSEWSGYDPKNYLLSVQSENSVSETYSYVFEDYFGLMDDGEGGDFNTDKPDVAVGRIPARTSEDAMAAVDKIEAYMDNKNAGNWQNIITFVADDGNENDHMIGAERMALQTETLYPNYRVERVYLDTYERVSSSVGNTYPMANKRMNEILEAGTLVLNYSGHGSPNQLAHETLFKLADFKAMKSKRLPLWITAACDVATFDMQKDNIGEAALFNKVGGAVAFIGTTRTVFSTQNQTFNISLMDKLLKGDAATGKLPTVGEALRQAKCAMIAPGGDYSNNKLCFVLMGDPALSLAAPTYRLVVDSIAGEAEDASPKVSAGQVVRVVGHVEDVQKNPITSFDGCVYPTVYDSRETVTGHNNDGSADEPFVFEERAKKLFSGADSIVGGRFSFSFPVPFDINYSDLSGQISSYAVSNDRSMEAHGSFENFLIGGVYASSVTDTVGPRIYAYLNYDEFPNGGKTGKQPCFVARLSDDSGISTVGNAVGHDLELIIDNQESLTYNLNSYYSSTLGDYTSGMVSYTLPTLSVGKHTLLFRAWDVNNNSSVTTLGFEVVDGLSPRLFDVRVSRPSAERILFGITTDQANSDISATLEIFDSSGRKLYAKTESGVAESGVFELPWDMSTDSGRILPGIYIYRVHVSVDGSESESKSDKVVVVRQ